MGEKLEFTTPIEEEKEEIQFEQLVDTAQKATEETIELAKKAETVPEIKINELENGLEEKDVVIIESNCELSNLEQKKSRAGKTLLLIRHPDYALLKVYILPKEGEGKTEIGKRVESERKEAHDIEDPLPLSLKGLKQSRLLLEHLKERFSKEKVSVFTSPIKRASRLGEMAFRRLEADYLGEMFTEKKFVEQFKEAGSGWGPEEYLGNVKRAKQEGISLAKQWFEQPLEQLKSILEKVKENVREGMKKIFEESSSDINAIIAHRVSLAVALRLTEIEAEGKKDFEINEEEIQKICEIARGLPYTSISEIKYDEHGKPQIVSKGAVPHLASHEELIGGTFK